MQTINGYRIQHGSRFHVFLSICEVAKYFHSVLRSEVHRKNFLNFELIEDGFMIYKIYMDGIEGIPLRLIQNKPNTY